MGRSRSGWSLHSAKKKRCSVEGCTNFSHTGGVCIRHGATKTCCSHKGCTNGAIKGGICMRHGAKVTSCKRKGCTNNAARGGVCIRHGAKVPSCSHEGCTNNAIQGRVCRRHGAKAKRCSHAGCTNISQRGGVCLRHGANLTRCRHEGCSNFARFKGGLCKTHGKRCGHDGCSNCAIKGRFCSTHGVESPATAPVKVEQLTKPAEVHEAASVGATAKKGGEIGVHNLQTNINRAPGRQSTSPCLSTMALNYPDDDEICAWIYKSSRISRLCGAMKSEEVDVEQSEML
jgi:hypothetical protein